MGMKFSLDDFGTGYSNMQRIVKLPFDIIKLDRTFTELYDNPKLGIDADECNQYDQGNEDEDCSGRRGDRRDVEAFLGA